MTTPTTSPATTASAKPAARRGDMDLLRAIACCFIVPAHAYPPFMGDFPYHIKAPERMGPLSVSIEVVPTVCLITFFFLAGWAAVGMSKSRSAWQFAKDRWLRLGIPLIAWMILVGPIVKYFERLNGRDMKISRYVERAADETDFLRFLVRYYTRMDHYTWSHLWFLAYLLTVSLACVPILRWMARTARPGGGGAVAWYWAYLPILPLLAIELLWRSYWPYFPNLITDWARVAFFGLFFVLGAAAMWRPGFEARLKAEAWRLLAIGVACWIYFTVARQSSQFVFGPDGFTTLPDPLSVRIAFAIGAWTLPMGIFGALARQTFTAGPAIRYLGEASMPAYILHHVFSIVAAYFVVQWPLPIWAKLLVIAAIAVAATFSLYHFAVRRIGVLRFIHGMPPALRPAARGAAP
jgi:peptidoglycan/LPS O-acetylase OafA/YrhL